MPGPSTEAPAAATRRALCAARRLAFRLNPPSVPARWLEGSWRLPGEGSSGSWRKKPRSTVRATARSTIRGARACASLKPLTETPTTGDGPGASGEWVAGGGALVQSAADSRSPTID